MTFTRLRTILEIDMAMLKVLSATVLSLVASMGAQAITVNLGTVSGVTIIGDTFAASGNFTDTFNFDLAGMSKVGADATNNGTLVSIGVISFTNQAISFFSGKLDGHDLTLTTTSTAGGNPYSTVVTASLKLDPQVILGTGSHSLVLKGTADVGSQYTGHINVSPVPEPETYAMFLAGLGALGLMAYRRRR